MPASPGTQQPTKRRGRPTSCIDPDPPKSRKRSRSSSVDTDTLIGIFRAAQEKRAKATISDASLEAPATTRHIGIHCDLCKWQDFTGIRYNCAVCEDYDLCLRCYDRNIHNLAHSFHQITKPGDQPVYLESARCNSSHAPTLNAPQLSTASKQDNFFYKTMSTAELKTFLLERGVESDDVLDNKTLCRRVWETYCECMSFAELNTFLSDRSIGCKDVNSRRQKAKDAFEPPSLSQSLIRFRKDDMVVLTGLKRAEMNGKMAKVMSVTHSEGKVLVKVEELDNKNFKIKLENLQQDGEIEELE